MLQKCCQEICFGALPNLGGGEEERKHLYHNHEYMNGSRNFVNLLQPGGTTDQHMVPPHNRKLWLHGPAHSQGRRTNPMPGRQHLQDSVSLGSTRGLVSHGPSPLAPTPVWIYDIASRPDWLVCLAFYELTCILSLICRLLSSSCFCLASCTFSLCMSLCSFLM